MPLVQLAREAVRVVTTKSIELRESSVDTEQKLRSSLDIQHQREYILSDEDVLVSAPYSLIAAAKARIFSATVSRVDIFVIVVANASSKVIPRDTSSHEPCPLFEQFLATLLAAIGFAVGIAVGIAISVATRKDLGHQICSLLQRKARSALCQVISLIAGATADGQQG